MKALLICSIAVSAALMAAPTLAEKTVAVVPDDVGDVSTLDEVVVTGNRALSAARTAIIEAENKFYARWNELNTDRKFDISCHQETPRDHVSRISHRVCQPAFAQDMEAAQAQQVVMAIQGGISSQGAVLERPSSDPTVMLLRRELRDRTLAMLRKDPELQRALLQRARLEQYYEDLRKEKFKDHWIRWN